MPNWVEQTIRIKGDISLLRQSGFILDEEPFVDFNGIIPMPEPIQQTVSPVTVLETQEEVDAAEAELKAKTPQPFYDQAFAGRRRYITREEHNELQSEYGATDWYEWAVNHWDTKWNACDAEIIEEHEDRIILKFSTAWSAPNAVYDALRKAGFRVDGLYTDEYDNETHEIGEGHECFHVRTQFEYSDWFDKHHDIATATSRTRS